MPDTSSALIAVVNVNRLILFICLFVYNYFDYRRK